MLKVSLPALFNTYIGIFKDTTLIMIIGQSDSLGIISTLIAQPDFKHYFIEYFALIAAIFWGLCLGIARFGRALEKRKVMSKHIINLHQVHASIMQKKILENIHLNVQPGEKIGIIGPSGSGKSSLIRIINLLLPPSSGQFHLFNKLVNPLQPPKEDLLKIGMVFQKFELFPHLTVMENLTLAPTLVKQYPLEKARDLAEKMLCRVGLKHFGDRFQAPYQVGKLNEWRLHAAWS